MYSEAINNLGFSTGALHPELTVPQALEVFAKQGITVTELGVDILDQPEKLTPDLLDPFTYVSLHAPKFPYNTDTSTQELFTTIKHIHSIRPLDLVVFHPDAVVSFDAFHNVSFPVGFENMDHTKPSHQTARELKEIFDQDPTWKLVLDVNHIYTNDPTMKLVEPFYELLGGRIAEIHLSGYATLHDPLFETKQDFIVRAVQRWDIPVLVESRLREARNIQFEKEYIESTASQAAA